MITVSTEYKGRWNVVYRFADNDPDLGVCIIELDNAGIAFRVGAS